VIKVVLAMQHRYLPPTVNYREPNPHIDFAASPFYVVDGAGRAWGGDGEHSSSEPLRAGVNAFGFGGTNCHVVLEQAPKVPRAVDRVPQPQLLCLTGRSEQSLGKIASNLRRHLESDAEIDPAAACLTAHSSQRDLTHRTALLARDRQHLLEQLAALEQGQAAPEGQRWSGRVNPRLTIPVVLVLDANTALDQAGLQRLTRRFPVVAAALAEAEANASGQSLFACQYALGRLLQALGIEPAAVIAEGRGTLAGACLGGLVNLELAKPLLAGEPLSGTVANDIPLFTPQGRSDRTLELTQLGRWLAADGRFPAAPEIALRDAVYLHLGADDGVHQRLGKPPRWVDLRDGDVVSALGELYALGVAFNYRPLAGDQVRRTPLPTYPFERKPFLYASPGEGEEAVVPPNPVTAQLVAEQPAPAPGLRRIRPTALKLVERQDCHAALLRELNTAKM
jgi:acyl transferase domain-containing protein